MRDEVRRAFDGITEAAHPALRASLRARLASGPVRGQSPAWRLAAAVAVLTVVVLAGLGSLYLLGRGNGTHSPALAGSASSPSPTPNATPSNQVTPAPSPSPIASPLPAFVCAVQSGGTVSGANVTMVRPGAQAGYDRLVFQFDGAVPPYTITPQDSSSFREDASGWLVQLRGDKGIRVVLRSSARSVNGNQTYQGPNDLTPGYPALKEARNVGDFERVYSWGLGVSGTGCFRVFTLTGPDRLVIDVQAE